MGIRVSVYVHAERIVTIVQVFASRKCWYYILNAVSACSSSASSGLQTDNQSSSSAHGGALTHHEALDVLHARLLDALPEEQNANTRPHEQQDAERDGYEPVQRRELERAAEHDVQGRRVDDEHAEARAREDAEEVVVVRDRVPAEGEPQPRLDCEDVEALNNEYRKVY